MGGVRILDILSFEEVEEITVELLKEANSVTDQDIQVLQKS